MCPEHCLNEISSRRFFLLSFFLQFALHNLRSIWRFRHSQQEVRLLLILRILSLSMPSVKGNTSSNSVILCFVRVLSPEEGSRPHALHNGHAFPGSTSLFDSANGSRLGFHSVYVQVGVNNLLWALRTGVLPSTGVMVPASANFLHFWPWVLWSLVSSCAINWVTIVRDGCNLAHKNSN